jgi:hypothetical protein
MIQEFVRGGGLSTLISRIDKPVRLFIFWSKSGWYEAIWAVDLLVYLVVTSRYEGIYEIWPVRLKNVTFTS